jgi:hypothetical protein
MAFSIRKAFKRCRLRRGFIECFLRARRVSQFRPALKGLTCPAVELFRFPLMNPARMIRGYFAHGVIFSQVGSGT